MENEVMNQDIVRLNEMKSVKMANITSKKRPIAKFMKEVAVYLTENWDNLDELEKCYKTMLDDMPDESCSEVMKIYEVRLKELRKKLEEEQEHENNVGHRAHVKSRCLFCFFSCKTCHYFFCPIFVGSASEIAIGIAWSIASRWGSVMSAYF